jgi:hypothetical protein
VGQPAADWIAGTATVTTPAVAHREVADVVTPVPPGLADDPGQPGRTPITPGTPAAVPGGSGSVGGFGGSHGADTAVTSPSAPLSDETGSGRGPPGTIAGLPWFGYDRPDCPS